MTVMLLVVLNVSLSILLSLFVKSWQIQNCIYIDSVSQGKFHCVPNCFDY